MIYGTVIGHIVVGCLLLLPDVTVTVTTIPVGWNWRTYNDTVTVEPRTTGYVCIYVVVGLFHVAVVGGYVVVTRCYPVRLRFNVTFTLLRLIPTLLPLRWRWTGCYG